MIFKWLWRLLTYTIKIKLFMDEVEFKKLFKIALEEYLSPKMYDQYGTWKELRMNVMILKRHMLVMIDPRNDWNYSSTINWRTN